LNTAPQGDGALRGGPAAATVSENPSIDRVTQAVDATDGRRRRSGAARTKAHRVLFVATLFQMPYRVMRCARAAGAEKLYVLTNPGARGLALSRHCARQFVSDSIIDGSRDELLAREINRLVRDFDITMVMPGDAPATRSLIASRDLIDAPCFPLPGLDEFDLLNNKWAFTRLCRTLAIRCPTTRLFTDSAALAQELASGHTDYPAVVKPVELSGNEGVFRLDPDTIEAGLRKIDYRPVLLQDFIDGDDIGASVYCRSGEIRAFVAHHLADGVYSTFWDQRIFDDIRRILEPLKVDGVYNFDMRRTPHGEVYYLECNPRFFFKIDLSMLAGINFVGLGLADHCSDGPAIICPSGQLRSPRALLSSPRNWTWRNAALALRVYSDPLPPLLERMGILG